MGIAPEPMLPSSVNPLPRTFNRPNKENPTLVEIRSRQQVVQAQRRAELAVKEAREFADRMLLQAEKKRRLACARQIEASRAVARAAEDAKRMKNVAKVEERAQELTKCLRKARKRDAAKLARKARKERERSKKMREEVEEANAAMKKEERRALKVAEERRREADTGTALAEKVSSAAAEKAVKAMEAIEDAAERLKQGIQPVVTPSLQEVAAAKWRIHYKDDRFHFAVVGVRGKRKSSLMNAFRGLRGSTASPAAVGAEKVALQMIGYPDANPKKPFIWYDVPAASNHKHLGWQFFNTLGLYIFDSIIVFFDDRFTTSDVAILTNARRFSIPTYIIRTNANQHIQKIMKGMRNENRGNIDVEDRLYEVAREQFIEKTRRSVQANLERVNLLDQRVYIVSEAILLDAVQSRMMPTKTIDELVLLNDLLGQAHSRRCTW